MPYADPEKRRQFHKQYKRRWRRAQEKIDPLRGVRIYLCLRFPGLHIPGTTSFYNGFLITDDPQVQAQVEAHELFAKHIFPLALDLTCTPKGDE
jgi:hypothetical protein